MRSSLIGEEQVRVNWIVGEIAGLLPCPTAEETLAELSEGLLVLGAEYFAWQLHVYLDLVEEEFDCPLSFWVLILSRGSERAFRVLEGDDFHQAALHIRRFVRDAALPVADAAASASATGTPRLPHEGRDDARATARPGRFR